MAETEVAGIALEIAAVDDMVVDNTVVVSSGDSLPITGTNYTLSLTLMGAGMLALGVSLPASFRRETAWTPAAWVSCCIIDRARIRAR